jgi:hypothetical protein
MVVKLGLSPRSKNTGGLMQIHRAFEEFETDMKPVM